jgi:hypothetical protein
VRAVRNITWEPVGFLSLTYGSYWPGDGREVKRALRAWRAYMVRRFGDRRAVWVLEFQGRGAPHLHVWLPYFVPVTAWADVRAAWHRCAYPNPRIRPPDHLQQGVRFDGWVARSPAALIAYVAKYGAKGEQKRIPFGMREVGRMWGISGTAKPDVYEQVQEVTVRAIRRHQERVRRSWGGSRRRRVTGGAAGFWAYGGAPVARALLHRGHGAAPEGRRGDVPAGGSRVRVPAGARPAAAGSRGPP